MDFSKVKSIKIPEGVVTKITAAGKVIWSAVEAIKNWVKYSTTSDGKTIYNSGLGYKNGYRLRSGGAESSHGKASHTGFIPVKPGDIVRVSGFTFSTADSSNAINASDSSFTNIGQLTPSYASGGYGIFESSYLAYSWKSVVQEKTGVWKWVVPPAASGVAYIRVTGCTGGDGSKMIVTVNEEITE